MLEFERVTDQPDLVPLLANVRHGVVIARLIEHVINTLASPTAAHLRADKLRAKLIGPLTEIRARASVISGEVP